MLVKNWLLHSLYLILIYFIPYDFFFFLFFHYFFSTLFNSTWTCSCVCVFPLLCAIRLSLSQHTFSIDFRGRNSSNNSKRKATVMWAERTAYNVQRNMCGNNRHTRIVLVCATSICVLSWHFDKNKEEKTAE